MENKKYYLGLDMGTNSVGWAVTDANYKILRAKGKDLWGIREFESANPAVERRTHRISRRRRQREQVRLGLLKSYFDEEIAKIDPNFFARLDNSKYHLEDKDDSVKTKNAIFDDPEYTDKDYYEEYKTIFHLRQELINNPAPHDIRLVYLAIANMFKHRGHFLNATVSDQDNDQDLKELYINLTEKLSELTNINLPSEIDAEKLKDILGNRQLSRSGKAEEINELLEISSKDKKEKLIIKGLCGLKIDAKNVFEELMLEEKLEINFSDFNYEEKKADIEVATGEFYDIIDLMKMIYDNGILAGILKGYKYLSDARVDLYNKHQQDLKRLKAVIRKYGSKEEYDEMFRSEEKGTYSAYVNFVKSTRKVRRGMDGRKRDDLYASIKKLFKKYDEQIKDDPEVEKILDEIAREVFLPKQLTSENGVIPNQVHAKELRKILKNASEYLPFLTEKDESGLTTAERVLELFKFQIPYFVGPTSARSEENKGNGWVVRKEEGQVLPWNIKDKIDFGKTQERFIERLVRECSYIAGEKVLPKGSLLYEKYCVLNEINNIRIDDEKIDVELKQRIYKELFQKGKRVTRKKLETYLINQGAMQDKLQLSGVDVNINNALSSYGKFYEIFGEKMKEDKCFDMCEEIVFLCTVYGDSKASLKEELKARYSGELTDAQIKRISGFKFKDWGRLSKEFLCLEGVNQSTGEIMSLIRALWETNYNMMELINMDEFTFKEALEKKKNVNMKALNDFKAEDLDEYYFSAPVKRMVWQTILIIKEIQKVMGCAPERIFIEMTRSEDEKKGDAGRKDSRKKQLLELYKSVKKDTRDWAKEIEQADADGTLRSKKVYLYYLQMGRCMYTGRPIDFEDLFVDNLYDIDHIYPRHFTKDDNLSNNLVLVYKPENARKTDTYPLDSSIRNNSSVRELWRTLREKNLITEEKYRRLTSNQPFSEDQLAGFIARQLVETSQGTKGVAELLKQLLGEQTKLVYSKASNVSDFRKNYGFMKSRLVNDFHHAHDAYLNIVVGNAYYVKFTQNPWNFIKNDYKKDPEKYKFHVSNMFKWNISRGGELAWKAESDQKGPATIATVKKMLAKNSPLMTRMSFEGHGGIAKEKLHAAKKTKPEVYIPLKSNNEKLSNMSKYGGFTDVSTAYFFLVEHEKKGKRIRTLEVVPVYLSKQLSESVEALEEYCGRKLGLVNPSVRVRKIGIQSLIKLNGYFVYITGRSDNRFMIRNAVNMIMEKEKIDYISVIEKWSEKFSEIEEVIISSQQRKIIHKLTNYYGISCDLAEVDRKKKDIINILNNKIYNDLVLKFSKGIFIKRPKYIGEELSGFKVKFESLGEIQQMKALINIFELSMVRGSSSDFRIMGGVKNFGLMRMGKTISNCDECKLINQSVTGIYEKSIDLLTV